MDKITEIRLNSLDENHKATTVWLEGLDNRIAEIGRDIVQIRTVIQPKDLPWAVRFLLLPLAVAAAVATVGAVIHLEIEIGGIKTSQTKQSLSAITAQANLVQAEGKTPNQPTIQEIAAASKAVTSAINKYPQYPEVWKAASSLVNLRSLSPEQVNIPSDVVAKVGPPIPNQGNCFAIPLLPSKLGQMGPEQANSTWLVSVAWHDCTLYMDDVDGFNRSTFMDYVRDKVGQSASVSVYVDLTLVRVNIVYHGSKIIPARKMIFYDCRFSFDVPSTPLRRGRDLLEAILSEGFEQQPLQISIPPA